MECVMLGQHYDDDDDIKILLILMLNKRHALPNPLYLGLTLTLILPIVPRRVLRRCPTWSV